MLSNKVRIVFFSTFLTILLLKVNPYLSIFVAWIRFFTLCFK